MTRQIPTDGLTRRPAAARGFVRGMAVQARDPELRAASLVSRVGVFAGLMTWLVTGPDDLGVRFGHQYVSTIGLEISGAFALPWVAYATFAGGRAVVRRGIHAGSEVVEFGRRDIEAAPDRFLE